MENKNLTAVQWFADEISIHLNFDQRLYLRKILEQAKQMEEQEQINLLKFSREMCTSEAPIEYIIKEFKKSKQ